MPSGEKNIVCIHVFLLHCYALYHCHFMQLFTGFCFKGHKSKQETFFKKFKFQTHHTDKHHCPITFSMFLTASLKKQILLQAYGVSHLKLLNSHSLISFSFYTLQDERKIRTLLGTKVREELYVNNTNAENMNMVFLLCASICMGCRL